MIEDCEAKGYAKPTWQSKSGVTILTFPDITITAKSDDTVNDTVNDTVSKLVKDRMVSIIHILEKKTRAAVE